MRSILLVLLLGYGLVTVVDPKDPTDLPKTTRKSNWFIRAIQNGDPSFYRKSFHQILHFIEFSVHRKLFSQRLQTFPAPNIAKDARIVGGSLTTIEEYPFQVALLFSLNLVSYTQGCGGSILNYRHILTSAGCVEPFPVPYARVRVGSTFANSGGIVHNVEQNFPHEDHETYETFDSDIAVVRLVTTISYNIWAQPAAIAGADYYLADNQPVWAIGWGALWDGGPLSEQLRHVRLWVVNQGVCRDRYAELERNITENMLCAGWLDVGGRDQCHGDAGGPLLHNGVVVGICSWGSNCAHERYPGVNTRVSRFPEWIEPFLR